MSLNRKAVALSVGLLIPFSAATTAQSQRADPQTLVVDDATIDWVQQSNVSAQRPGVIDKIELRIGKEVGRAGDVIGILHKETADLSVKEAEIQANGQGAIMKAEASKRLAAAVVNRNELLNRKVPNSVSGEEVQKAQAEFLMAKAGEREAADTQDLAKAKLASAQQAAAEHVIRAPFAGIVIEEFKHEGESVQANEAVIRLGNLDRVRVWTYIPIEYAYRVAIGTEIEIQPRLVQGNRTGRHPIEQKKFRGVVTFVDPTLQAQGESGVRVYAEIDNPAHELRPGLKATMTFFLRPETTTPLGTPAGSEATVGSRPGVNDLPALPR